MYLRLLMASVVLFSASVSFAGGCPDATVFSKDPVSIPTRAKWRSEITNVNADGTTAKTNSDREREIKAVVASQIHDTTVSGETPGMEFFPSSTVEWEYTRESPGYPSDVIDQIKVSHVGASGILEGTLVLPVSGHVSIEKALIWAVTDTYSVEYKGVNNNRLVSDAKSLGPATVQEVKIPLIKDQPVTIFYDRKGSAGPGGFPAGRKLEIVWDGT